VSFHTSPKLLATVPLAVFAVLTVGIAIVPAISQSAEYKAPPAPPEDVLRGRASYIAEGCSYCHTQQVRSDVRLPRTDDGWLPALAQDARYGPASRPTDYAGDEPPVLGTQRNGPDLMNVGMRMPSKEWHYLHLYDPRLVSPGSNMPAYKWYFHTAEDHEDADVRVPVPDSLRSKGVELFATPAAQDLVKYLLWLKPASRTAPR
jgi:cytochrome c oxidase cbb3-type subunit 2